MRRSRCETCITHPLPDGTVSIDELLRLSPTGGHTQGQSARRIPGTCVAGSIFVSLLRNRVDLQISADIRLTIDYSNKTCTERRRHARQLGADNLIFPYCRCDDYKLSSSPYELRVTSAVAVGFGTQVTMTLASRPVPVDVQTVCYKKMLASLEKIGFGTREWEIVVPTLLSVCHGDS